MLAKIKAKNIVMAIAGLFLLSCAPKYTAHFQQKSYDPDRYRMETNIPEEAPVALTAVEKEVIKNEVRIKEVVVEPKEVKKLVNEAETEIIKPQDKSELIKALKENPDATIAIQLDRKERRALKREVKEQLKAHKDHSKAMMQTNQNESRLLYYILAVLLPPLAVGLWRGIGSDFWINILLTLLLYLPGIIHAIIVISSKPKMSRSAAY